jgi:hypothetical protein
MLGTLAIVYVGNIGHVLFGRYQNSRRRKLMAKRLILYNLKENVTDEQFKEYVQTDKGPLISSLPSVKKYELVRITGATAEKIPYRYVGIVHVTSIEEFNEKAAKTEKYQGFLQKFGPMVSDMLMLSGEEIY